MMMMMMMIPSPLSSLVALLALCAAQGSAAQGSAAAAPSRGQAGSSNTNTKRQERLELSNFSRLSAVSAAVAGDYLYVDGGQLTLVEDDGDFWMNASSEHLAFPITNSWTNQTLQYRTMDKASPRNSYQYLFANSTGNGIYAWGGEATSGMVNETSAHLWKFEPDQFGGGQWIISEPADEQEFKSIKRNVHATSASCGNKAFFLGGYASNLTDYNIEGEEKVPTPGLVTYDMETRRWTNESAPSVDGLDTYYRGGAVCLPDHSDEGLVLYFGGEAGGREAYVNPPEHFVTFENITIYDPATKEWHSQTTTGSPPTRRSRFCSVSVQSSANTTEIFVYGGFNERVGSAFDEVYVLSLPAFHWFRADYPAVSPRADLACAVAGNRQMIVVGGMNEGITTSLEDKLEDLDPWWYGIGVFDMTDMQWKDRFDSSAAAYESPSPVRNWYTRGNLDNVDWTSTTVRDMFLGDSGSHQNPDNGNGGEEGDGEEEEDDSSGPSGALVGGVTGGVLGGVALIGSVGVYLWLRRRRSQNRKQRIDSSPPSVRGMPSFSPPPPSPPPPPGPVEAPDTTISPISPDNGGQYSQAPPYQQFPPPQQYVHQQNDGQQYPPHPHSHLPPPPPAHSYEHNQQLPYDPSSYDSQRQHPTQSSYNTQLSYDQQPYPTQLSYEQHQYLTQLSYEQQQQYIQYYLQHQQHLQQYDAQHFAPPPPQPPPATYGYNSPHNSMMQTPLHMYGPFSSMIERPGLPNVPKRSASERRYRSVTRGARNSSRMELEAPPIHELEAPIPKDRKEALR